MTEHDLLLRQVSQLTVLTPDERRAEHLLVRCRARLARRRAAPRQGYGPALLAGFCVLYLSAIVHDVLRWRGML
jgi:hypothetical protein